MQQQIMKSELDLFSTLPLQTNVLSTENIILNPATSLTDSPLLQFNYFGNSEYYVDLSHTYLSLIIEVDANMANPANANAAQPCVVNNIISSLFSQLNIYLNDTCVSVQNNNYQYRALFDIILNYGQDGLKHLENNGFYLDSGDLTSFDNKKNPSLKKRREVFAPGKKVALYGRVHGDIINQHKWLPNNMKIRFEFTKSKPEFYMFEKEEDSKSIIKIHQANLIMRQHKINPDILLAHSKVLQSGSTAKYQFKRIVTKTHTTTSGTQTLSIENLIFGSLPTLITIAFVSNGAYNGARNTNPFNFHHYNIQQLYLVVNGMTVPTRPIEYDFTTANSKNIARGFHELYVGTGYHFYDKGNQITKDLFENGYFLQVFNLCSDGAYDASYINPIQNGTVRLEAKFRIGLDWIR